MIPITQHLLHSRAEADRLKYLLIGVQDQLDVTWDKDTATFNAAGQAGEILDQAIHHLESAEERITEAAKALGVEIRP